MDRNLLRYIAAGGLLSLLFCILLCMVLGSFVPDAVTVVAVIAIFALPGVVAGSAYVLYQAIRDRRDETGGRES